ncbi:hypothetical protein [Polaribacter vadi]|nr:hypothetical protein [Polaribacter vadi]
MRFQKLMIICTLIISLNQGYTQNKEKANWYSYASKTSVKIGDEIDLFFKVEIAHNWFIYAINQKSTVLPSLIANFKPKNCELIGEPKSLEEVTIINQTTQEYANLYSGISGGFKQRIKITGKHPTIHTIINYALVSLDTGEYELKEKKINIKIE